MDAEINFNIKPAGNISTAFIERNVVTFFQAIAFIRQLPYRRNKHKEDLTTVFTDGYGTCSTKHALLKQLAIENNAGFVKLKLGIFKMNKENTPKIADTLATYGLEYIPEAHNYLQAGNQVIDCTTANASGENFMSDLMTEIEIQPDQITSFKVDFHKQILAKWLAENNTLGYTLPELWAIREACISDLQK